MGRILDVYYQLLKSYGPQGWWPIVGYKGVNPTKTGSVSGYHPNNYSFPRTKKEEFEICIGALLAQNTAWPNVEKAFINLGKARGDAKAILKMSDEKLKSAIKPAGYFNQKGKKLKIFAEFYMGLKNRIPSRNELLGIWGIGPETADSMLLYAFKVPEFVVDNYTKRIFLKLGIINENAKYDDIKNLFESAIPRDIIIYQEYHALIVEHAKREKMKNR